MKRKQGISLIVLVITIIVMIILAAAVVVSLNNTGIIGKANVAVNKTNFKQVEQMASLYWADAFADGLRGENLKDSVLGKLEDYTDDYDFVVTDGGVTVTEKSEGNLSVPEPIFDYFTYEYDTTNMTATLVGVKEQYSESSYYTWTQENTNYYFSSAIIGEDGEVITDVVVPSTTIDEEGNTYTVTALNAGVFAPDIQGAGSCQELIKQLARYTSIELPDTITTIADYAFISCTSLKNIKLPSNLKDIGYEAFYNCTSLQSIVIPNGVTEIESWTFYGCTALKTLTLQQSITAIKDSAFCDCTSLTDVYYTGTEAEWNAITIGNYNNTYLINATKHYNHVVSE